MTHPAGKWVCSSREVGGAPHVDVGGQVAGAVEGLLQHRQRLAALLRQGALTRQEVAVRLCDRLRLLPPQPQRLLQQVFPELSKSHVCPSADSCLQRVCRVYVLTRLETMKLDSALCCTTRLHLSSEWHCAGHGMHGRRMLLQHLLQHCAVQRHGRGRLTQAV